MPFEDIRPGKWRRYLIKGLMPRVGMIVVWGPPKCGNTGYLTHNDSGIWRLRYPRAVTLTCLEAEGWVQ